jgi:acetyltransferase-like isoleucine patch superfamily enzyme
MKPIISPNCRIRHPEYFSVGEYSIIDDFSYFSTKVKIGMFSHIASGCSIAGGKERLFVLGDYCSLSSGVKIWCASNDFVNDLIIIKPNNIDISDKPIKGDVIIGDMCGVGANSVIMPNNKIPNGVVIGALSFVPTKFKFKPWSVYAGIPIKLITCRNKENVMKQVHEIESKLKLNKGSGNK